jgi:hypothetical protein
MPAGAKVERQRAFAEALSEPVEPEYAAADDLGLDDLLDMVAERVIEQVGAEAEPEQGFFAARPTREPGESASRPSSGGFLSL